MAVGLSLSSCASRGRPVQPEVTPVAPTHEVIPAPVSAHLLPNDRFVLTPDTSIAVPAGNDRVARLGQYLSDLIGLIAGPAAPPVETATSPPKPGSISLEIASRPSLGPEGYELTISPERVSIVANEPVGLFYGVQTFRQLLPPAVEYEAARVDTARPISAPAAQIVDQPRFAWRGSMLDVARHFLSVDEVLRYIDLMALYKLNRLHLHLSDDQGWRIEITSWPNLTVHGGRTEVGGTPGGFYTQADYRRMVEYAAERFITIVPEIDMPGHTNAALASYAELNCDGVARPLYTGIEVGFSSLCVGKDVTYRFIDDVVREIGALTPGPYFHVGGDEVKTLTADDYARFIERVQGIVQRHGKVMLGWDEVAATSLSPTSVVQVWRPEANPADAVAKGTKVILSPASRVYLDMKYDPETALGLNWAGYVAVRTAYDWDPASFSAAIRESAILGVEAPVWSETLANVRDVEYMALPRLAAVAEVGWSPASQRSWEEFRVRLGRHGPRLTALGASFKRVAEVPWQP